MNRKGIILMLGLALLVSGLAASSGDVLKEIGCTTEEAQDSIFNNFYSGNLYPPHCNKAYKAVPRERRAGLVKLLGEYVRGYVESEAFQARYLAEWERSKPSEPVMEQVASADSQLQEMEKGIRETEAQLNSPYLSQEQKDALRQSIESMRQMMASQDYRSMMQQGNQMQLESARQTYQEDMEKYRQNLAVWEGDKDYRRVLRTRLQAFLDLTTDIDFDARLTQRGRSQVFADPALESKSQRWKLCFRCGREAVEAARAFASAWLRDLGGK